MACNVTAAWRAYKRGAGFANPCFVQIHPTCIPVHGDYQSKLTLMSESLRNDGRVWVPKKTGDSRKPADIPEGGAGLLSGKQIPELRQPGAPRRRLTQRQGACAIEGKGVGGTGLAVYLDFADAIKRDGGTRSCEKYGNLFQMYEKITANDPSQEPMMIYPAVHYTMGGLWVDYDLMTTIPGLFAIGECNFSDHGANRLGASALMQGLADGYFILPCTISNYLAQQDQREQRVHIPSLLPWKKKLRVGLPCSSVSETQEKEPRLLTNSTAGSVRCFGSTAAWPETRKACSRH